jgi:GRIP domain
VLEERKRVMGQAKVKLQTAAKDLKAMTERVAAVEEAAAGAAARHALELTQLGEELLSATRDAAQHAAAATAAEAALREARAELARVAEAAAAEARSSGGAAQAEVAVAAQAADALRTELAAYKKRAGAALRAKDAEIAALREGSDAERASPSRDSEPLLAKLHSELAELRATLQQREEAFAEELEQSREAGAAAKLAAAAASEAARADVVRLRREAAAREAALSHRVEELSRELEMLRELSKERRVAGEQAAELARQRCAELEAEFSTFRRLALELSEAKDADAAALRNQLARLRGREAVDAEAASPRAQVDASGESESLSLASDAKSFLEMATLQASRDGALGAATQRATRAEEAAASAIACCDQLRAQLDALTSSVEEGKRAEARTRVDVEYVKNVCLKLLTVQEDTEAEALSLVVGTLLCFSKEEMAAVDQAAERRKKAKQERGGGAAGYLSSFLGYAAAAP